MVNLSPKTSFSLEAGLTMPSSAIGLGEGGAKPEKMGPQAPGMNGRQ